MAAKYETVYSSEWVGTDGNDTHSTRDYEWIDSTQTGRTTIYSALRGQGGDDKLINTFIYKDMSRENVTIDGGAGNDTIDNRGENPSLVGGAGNDSIRNGSGSNQKANNPTLEGGAGDDTINSEGDNALITAGDGDDSIYSYGDKATILSGAGADNILIYGDNATISGGDGSDTITNNGDKATIDGGAGDDSIHGNGSDITINGGEGADSLNGWGNSSGSIDAKVLLEDTIGNNYFKISFTTEGSVIGGAGDDYIRSDTNNKNLLIDAGAGDNTVSTWYDNNTTIKTYGGNDSISISDSNKMLIDAGEGDNYVGVSNINNADAADNTITTSTGLDTVGTSGKRFLILTGDGDDSIKHIGANSTIRGGDGDDYIYNYDGGRDYATNPTIGANNLVEGGAGNDSLSNACDSVTIDGGIGDDSIDSGAVDRAVLIGGEGNDSIYSRININHELPTNTTIDGGAGDDFIYNVGNQVTINAGEGNDTIFIATALAGTRPSRYEIGGESVLIDYTAGDGNDLIQGFRADSTLSIVGGEYSSVVSDNNVVLTVGDDKITLEGAASLETLNIVGTYSTVKPVATKGASINNTVNNTLVTGTDYDDTIENSGSNVTIQSFAGNDILTGGKRKNTFVYSGGNDTITDYKKADKISTASDYENYSVNDKDLIFNFGDDNSLTLQDDASKLINLNFDSNYYTADGILDKRKKSITLLDTVEKFTADSKVMTIDGSATGAIEITGNKKKNYIIAGATGSTLNGGKGNDTLVGGAGADLFIYDNRTGKDVISGFSAGDSISLDSNVTIKDAKTKSGDTVLKFKGGGLTVKDTTEFKFGDTLYSGGVFIADDTAKVYGSYRGTINLADYSVANFDGSEGKKKLTITGSDSANSIVGGKGKDNLNGGAGNDTLWGGKGNDTLTGGAGNDTFIFQAGNGKDFITDYAASDMLQILDKKGDAGDFKKATFKDDTLTLNIKGGGKVILGGVESSTAININGESKSVSNLIG